MTAHVVDGQLDLRVVVNSTKDNTGRDGLVGEEDLMTDHTNLGGWGGLGGHVTLESRGPSWIVWPWIQSDVKSPGYDTATVNTSIEVGGIGATGGAGLSMSVRYADAGNATVGTASTDCDGQSCHVGDLVLKNPPLWSPRSPQNQLVAEISLLDHENNRLDFQRTSFGLQKLEVLGYHWKLNGVRNAQPPYLGLAMCGFGGRGSLGQACGGRLHPLVLGYWGKATRDAVRNTET